MDPSRKRTIRLVVALGAALVLAAGLVVTSFSSSSEATTPRALLASAEPGQAYQLTGTVADGSYRRDGDRHTFRVRERAGSESVPVRYDGTVPDSFREGREVIVTVRRGEGGTFVGERDSLITKCPSKFQEQPGQGS
jgi:cytochrome c-type biogenesis protein CcmE